MDASSQPYNVLFLGTRNCARSILAEAILNHRGAGRFRGFSAGSYPKGIVHPIALRLLTQLKLPTAGLRSKSWEEFAAPHSVPVQFVVTLYDAADHTCPYWPGPPTTCWEIANPTLAEGSEADKWLAFRATLKALEERIEVFASLQGAALERLKLPPRRRIDLPRPDTTPAPTSSIFTSSSAALSPARPRTP
jgi:arsenate reductase